HSYLGDLTIYLTCPNGQSIDFIVYPNGCGGTFLGEPVDNGGGDSEPPGVGYMYCWTPSATNGTWAENCGSGSTLPAGDYEAESPWTNLLGCPLNGDWTINITDNLYSDDGFIFQWNIGFDPALIPDNLWEFENHYDPADYAWTGENITTQSNGIGEAQPTTSGDIDYTFTATDDFGCAYDTVVSVYVRPAGSEGCCVIPQPDAGPDEAVCGFSYNLNASLTPGNTGSWVANGPGNATFTNSTSNTSEVTVDAFGTYEFVWLETNSPACASSDTVNITFNSLITSNFTVDSIACYLDSSSVTYTGNATSAANYHWDFGLGNANGSGQGPYNVYWGPGTHTVSLYVEENGCFSDTTSNTLTSPEELISKPENIDNLCFGYCQGIIGMNVEGGTQPYTYSWAAQDTMYNLCAGIYTCTVTDANGCTVDKTIEITEPTEITGTTSVVDANCSLPDGSATVTATGGTVAIDYSYLWDDPDGQTTQTASELFSGIYNVTVTDDNGCTFDTLANISNLAGVVGTLDTVVHVSCFGLSDGYATYSVTGGTADYTFEWSTNTTTTSSSMVNTEGNLSADLYTVSVTDANGCTHSEYFTITEPTQLIASIEGTDVNCNGGSDGAADLTVEGGTPPYTYIWNTTDITEDLSNIPAGAYTVTVSDDHSCSVITAAIISEPPIPLVVSLTEEDVSCYEGSDGSIQSTTTGGTSPYNYLWSNNATTQNIDNIPAGLYSVVVTDSNACTTTSNITVNEPTELVYTISKQDASCHHRNDGEAQITASGGTPPYQYLWSNNVVGEHIQFLLSDVYYVTATDNNGCFIIDSIKIVEPDAVVLSQPSDRIICMGENIDVNTAVTGGSPNYTVNWSTGQTGSSINIAPLEDTIITLIATDANGCKSLPEIVKIDVRPPITASIFADIDSICKGEPVELTADATGGLPPYQYFINDEEVELPLIVYPEATLTYELEVIDSCGSPKGEDDTLIFVHELPPISFIPDTNQGCVPLTIFFNETNPYDNQSYEWDFGDPGSQNYSDLKNPTHIFNNPGVYDVELRVTSKYGCSNTVRVEEMITAYPIPVANFEVDPKETNIADA
ncbi:MAG: hypothetical protein C0594_14800, partial [Marinilabiliales bacterium]